MEAKDAGCENKCSCYEGLPAGSYGNRLVAVTVLSSVPVTGSHYGQLVPVTKYIPFVSQDATVKKKHLRVLDHIKQLSLPYLATSDNMTSTDDR